MNNLQKIAETRSEHSETVTQNCHADVPPPFSKKERKKKRIREFEDGLPLIKLYQGESYGEALHKSFYSKLDAVVKKEAETGRSCGSMWWFVPKNQMGAQDA